MNVCLLGELCVWRGDRNDDGTMVICDGCELDIHKLCDKKIKNLVKLPDMYYCPLCTKKRAAAAAKKGRKRK